MKTGKKIMLTIGIVLLVLLVSIAALLLVISKKPVVPTDYTQTVETGGEIEAKYMANGTYEVSYFEESVLQGFGKYVIYYPAELENADKTWPVVVVANGSGCKASKYPALFEHLASWGFIVIGTEEEYDWNGFASEMCVRHLLRLNEIEIVNDKDNPFRGKIDLDNVGITGHRQGGVGVINAITAQEHKGIYNAAVSLSPTNKELAHNLEWDYDATKITAPILIFGGDNDWVATKEQFHSFYDDIPGEKCMALRVDTEHGPMLYSGDGYVTAWFMHWLQGDEYAGTAFFGENAEIRSNVYWQDTDAFFQENEDKAEEQQITYTDYVAMLTSSITSIINVISYVLIAFVAVSLAVSCIMIGIVTYISVIERTKEIGVLRALGASKKNISQVFNAETFIIGICSGAIGVGASALITIPVNTILGKILGAGSVNVALPVESAVVLVVISMIVTVIGGLYPSKKAAKKDPVIALRTE